MHMFPAILTLGVGFFLAVISVQKGRWRTENLLFALICLLWSLNSFFFLVHRGYSGANALLIERVHHGLYVWIPLAHLHFIYRWLDLRNLRMERIALWSTTGFFLMTWTPWYVSGVHTYSWGTTAQAGPVFFLDLVYAVGIAAHLIRLCRRRMALAVSNEEKRALSIVTWALAMAALLAVLNVPSFVGVGLYTPGNLVCVPMLVLAYAVLRYRMLNVRTIIHHSMVWAVVSSLILIPNLLLIYWLRPYFNSLGQPTLFLFFFCVFYLNYRYSKLAQPFIDRLFNRQRFDLQKVEAHFTENILLLRRTEVMVEEFRRTVEATLRIRGMVFFTRKGEGFSEEKTGRALEFSREALHWLSLLQVPIDAREVEKRATSREVRREVIGLLEQCRCTYIVSLARYGELLGLVLLPEKSDFSRINPQEERFITRIKAFVSIALYNSTVYQNLSGLKEELARHTDALAQEVSQRKRAQSVAEESERRYRLLADNVMDTIAILDANPLVFTYLSPSVRRHLGYREDQLIGRQVRDVLTEFSEMEVRGILKKALASPRSKTRNAVIFETELKRKDGSRVWSEISARFLRGESGEAQQILLVSRDVTGRKHLEREREALQRRLRQAQKMESIGVLAGSIAHDFNNILMAMMGYTQLAMMHIPESNVAARKKMAMIDRAGIRARDLVAQILAFSRQNEQKSEACYLRAIVQDTVGFLSASLPSNIEITYTAGKGPLRVVADPVQVHQIIINLATNAFHAIGEEGGTIGIELDEAHVDEALALELHLPEGPYVCITVADDGHGVDPEIASRIFEPYYTTKEVGKGTGMGLAVVHGIVLNHGGAVHMESERSAGARFHIYLPTEELNAACSHGTEGGSALRESKGLVLLVDGEDILIDLAREVLARLGYQVEAFTDSDKALEVFQEYPSRYAAVVAEAYPHDFGFVKAIRTEAPDVPMVVTSTTPRHELAEVLIDYSIQGLLTKPFTLKELAEELEQVVSSRSDAPEIEESVRM